MYKSELTDNGKLDEGGCIEIKFYGSRNLEAQPFYRPISKIVTMNKKEENER